MEKKSESTEWNLFPLFVFGVLFFFLLQGLVAEVCLEVRGDFGREVCWPYLLGDWPDRKICP